MATLSSAGAGQAAGRGTSTLLLQLDVDAEQGLTPLIRLRRVEQRGSDQPQRGPESIEGAAGNLSLRLLPLTAAIGGVIAGGN